VTDFLHLSRGAARQLWQADGVAHREANGLAEIHQESSDLMFIVSGAASHRVGGDIESPYTEPSGEMRGATGRGGDIRTLRPRDVINVPAGVPNQFLVQAG
jgi:mannose-6-phosphate isomerase-like protein (cupin superfamily)